MIKKTVPISFTYVPILIDDEGWIILENILCHSISEGVRDQIYSSMDKYIRNICSYSSGVRRSRAKKAIRRIEKLSGDLAHEMSHFVDKKIDYNAAKKEMDKFEQLSNEWILKAMELSESPPLLSSENVDFRAISAAFKEIANIAYHIFNTDISILSIYEQVSLINKCAKISADNIKDDKGRDGDPHLDELLLDLSSCFKNAGGSGVYTEKSVKFIKESCRLVSIHTEQFLDALSVSSTRRITEDQIKDRIKKALGEKSAEIF